MSGARQKHAVVLGAGVIGVACAYYLAKDGHRVTVIDRQQEPAAETSFANAGLIAPGHALTWASPRAPKILWRSLFSADQALRLKLRADPRMWAWCLAFLRNCNTESARINTTRKLGLCRYSQQALQALVAETKLEYERQEGGLLYLHRNEASLEAAIRNMAILRENGLALETVDRAACARIEPALEATKEKIAGGLYCPSDESGDCHLFTVRLAALCKNAGVVFRFGTTITGFATTGDEVETVLTDDGPVAGDVFVLALGPYSAILGRKLGLRLPVYPIKGYSATVPIDGHNGAPRLGGVDDTNLVAWARMGDRLRLTATAEFTGFDTSHRPEDFRAMLSTARDLFPDGGAYDRASYWACLRPMTPEGTPLFGRRRQRNLFLNTGQGHMGWTMACGSGRVVADLIAGRPPEIDLSGMVAAA
ncbi:MAG: D-amino acid dehydrogenase [Alphaproteobacteria bacterium]|nr:D-amino acid dehydrogenase [Alphaproteobacteria bacterium]